MFEPLRLTVAPETAQVVPGGRLALSLTVHNASSIADRYRLAVSGVPDDWYELDKTAVSLFPGASEQVQLTVHPPAGTATPAGSHPFTVRATSDGAPSIRAAVVVALTVGTVGGVSMDVLPAEAEGREATYRIMFVNQSNAGVAVELGAQDTEDGLCFRVQPDWAVTVPAGGQAVLLVRVRPKVRETIGQPHPYEIAFRGLQPGTEDEIDPTLVRPARFTHLPRITALALPRWLRRLPVLALLLLLLLLLLVLFFTGYGAAKATSTSTHSTLPTPIPTATRLPTAPARDAPSPTATRVVFPPQIKRFDVQARSPGSVKLVWAVTGASEVLLNRHPVPTTGTGMLHIDRLTTLVLSATSEGGTRTQIVQLAPKPIYVRVPRTTLALPVIHFDARTDLRTHKLALVWSVAQVTSTTLNNVPVEWTGTREITLSASRPITYSLRATNTLGTVTEGILLPKQPSPVVQYIHLPSISFRLVHKPGHPYTLVWQLLNAAYAALNGRHVPTHGSLALPAPVHSKTYQLEASNSAGRVTAQLRIVVRSATSPSMLFVLTLPRIVAFAVRRAKGQQLVTWRVQNAVHVWLQGKRVPAAGEQVLRDDVAAVHLLVTNDVGSQQRSVSITRPTPTPMPTPTAHPTASATPQPSATGTPRPTHTPTPTAQPTHTPTALPTATHTPLPEPTVTPTPTPILEPTVMPTPTPPQILEPTVRPGSTPPVVTASLDIEEEQRP